MMQPFTLLTGAAAVLPLANVDTDVIIRIERLTEGDPRRLGEYAFEALRYDADGREDPGFPLNRPFWRDAPILLAGPNFGCGSSREGAVVALAQKGIRCIVAESFGEIFMANCYQNGLLPIRLPERDVLALMDAAARSDVPFRVNLPAQLLFDGEGREHRFDIDPLRLEGLVSGLDDLGLTLRDANLIHDWQRKDRTIRPWMWNPVARDSAPRTAGAVA